MARNNETPIRVGLLGAGTVGSQTARLIVEQKDELSARIGRPVELTGVACLDPKETEKFPWIDQSIVTTDTLSVATNSDIVIELIGGTTVARDVVVSALEAGKNVVTANKALMATHGEEVMHLAEKMNRELAFEASVGGGIPIIDPLKHSLISNEITSVMGIVNGTTNYMLTRMVDDNLSYDQALKEAQERGFAEADPTADVDGFDAAAKIAILASIAFNSRVTLDDVHTEGIRNITTLDLDTADDMGYVIKLLAIAHRTPDGIDVRVHPTMLPKAHQLATVNGVFNAIYVTGDAVGETMFFGEGAGAGPAASAVMGDVLEVARHLMLGVSPIVGCTCTDNLPILPVEELQTKYYIRFAVADRSGVLAAMAGVFAKHGVSVRSVVQRGNSEHETVNLSYVTHTAKEASVRAVLAEIAGLEDVLRAEPSVIRVEG